MHMNKSSRAMPTPYVTIAMCKHGSDRQLRWIYENIFHDTKLYGFHLFSNIQQLMLDEKWSREVCLPVM